MVLLVSILLASVLIAVLGTPQAPIAPNPPKKKQKPKEVICHRPNELFIPHVCRFNCKEYGALCDPIQRVQCDCIDNFARDQTDTCISIFHCGRHLKGECIDPHLEYRCDYVCRTECSNLEKPCPDLDRDCIKGCYCKDGYKKALNGKCVPTKLCPKVAVTPLQKGTKNPVPG